MRSIQVQYPPLPSVRKHANSNDDAGRYQVRRNDQQVNPNFNLESQVEAPNERAKAAVHKVILQQHIVK